MRTRPLFEGTLFWSLYASVYDVIWNSPLTAALAGAAEAHAGAETDVVDLGCGTGLMTRGSAARVVGVDSSESMLNRALKRGRISQAVRASAEVTGLPGASAETVIVSNILHLCPDPVEVLREAERLCRPHGTVFACWPLDGIDTRDVYVADRSMGRSFTEARVAHTLRSLVGITAAFTGTRRHTSAFVEQAVLGAEGFEVLQSSTLAGCQRIVVLRKNV